MYSTRTSSINGYHMATAVAAPRVIITRTSSRRRGRDVQLTTMSSSSSSSSSATTDTILLPPVDDVMAACMPEHMTPILERDEETTVTPTRPVLPHLRLHSIPPVAIPLPPHTAPSLGGRASSRAPRYEHERTLSHSTRPGQDCPRPRPSISSVTLGGTVTYADKKKGKIRKKKKPIESTVPTLKQSKKETKKKKTKTKKTKTNPVAMMTAPECPRCQDVDGVRAAIAQKQAHVHRLGYWESQGVWVWACSAFSRSMTPNFCGYVWADYDGQPLRGATCGTCHTPFVALRLEQRCGVFGYWCPECNTYPVRLRRPFTQPGRIHTMTRRN